MADKTSIAAMCAIYLTFLFCVGGYYFIQGRKQTATMASHYLANKSFGPLILTMTMFATLFSGYTVVGVPNDGYREGFLALKWLVGAGGVTFFAQLVVFPRLRRLSELRDYSSPTDFIQDRYRSRGLTYVSTGIMLCSSFFYLVAQLVAMKSTSEGLTSGKIDGMLAATILALIMLVYEALGGLKSVAVTDLAQGFVMLISLAALYIISENAFGLLADHMRQLAEASHPYFTTPLTFQAVVDQWAFILSMITFPLYPTFITRCYSAKTFRTLRFACMVLPLTPLLCQLPGVLLGLHGKDFFKVPPAEFYGSVMDWLLGMDALTHFFISMMMTGALASIMSTADSYLIACSNIAVVDIFGILSPTTGQKGQVGAGRLFSVVITALALGMAALPVSLSPLFEFQGALLSQLLPAFLLGLYSNRFSARPLLAGVAVGLVVIFITQGLKLGGVRIILPVSLWSTISNFIVVVVVQMFWSKRASIPTQPYGVPESKTNKPRLEHSKDSEGRPSIMRQTIVGGTAGSSLNFRRQPQLDLQGIEVAMADMHEPIFAARKLAMFQVLLLIFMGLWPFIGQAPGCLLGFTYSGLYQLLIMILMALANIGLAYHWAEPGTVHKLTDIADVRDGIAPEAEDLQPELESELRSELQADSPGSRTLSPQRQELSPKINPYAVR